MNCTEFREIASEWVEIREGAGTTATIEVAERPGVVFAVGDVKLHVDGCGRCQGLVSDLAAIRTGAGEYFESEVEPPEVIWRSIRAELEAEGIIHPAGERGWRVRLANWFPTMPRPAIAGAYTLVLLLGAGLIGWESLSGIRQTIPVDYSISTPSLGMQLAQAERRTVAAMRNRNPAVTASLNRNLAIVDKFIGLCEKSVRENPQDELAREYLYDAYQQKADLLAMMQDRGVNNQ